MKPTPLIELVLADGSEYVVLVTQIAAIARKSWKNIDDYKKNVCTIYLNGGGQVHIEGAKYPELKALWLQKLEIYLDDS